MKKLFTIGLLGLALAASAEPCGTPPRRHHGGHRPAPPPARYHHNGYRDYYHYRNHGIGLAESIVSLVGVGVNILRPVVYDVVNYTNPPTTTTVIEQPQGRTVIQQTQPVTLPAVQPVYTAPVTPVVYPTAVPAVRYAPVRHHVPLYW